MSKNTYKTKNYRKIWSNNNGPIPEGCEIHHIDGNHNNNHISNLQCVTLQEHFDIHISQGDFHAAALIAHRMKLPKDYISKLQTGTKRPGIGGRPKGSPAWNKGISNPSARKRMLHNNPMKDPKIVEKVLKTKKLNNSDSKGVITRYKHLKVEYAKSPKVCPTCNTIMPYERRHRTFCNKSCAVAARAC